MICISATLPNSISVDGIYSVLKVDFRKPGVGIGEAHNFPELSFVSRGAHLGICDGKQELSHSGELRIIGPGTFHKSSGISDSELLIICFKSDSEKLEELYNKKIALSEEQDRECRRIVEIGLELFERRAPGDSVRGMVVKPGADKSRLELFKKRLELFLLDLHVCYASPIKEGRATRNAKIISVHKFLLEHIGETMTTAEIAEQNSMCASKLKLIFKEKGGVINYFISLKIERAKELIAEGKMNFTEISDHLGFCSIHYFSRIFKKFTGITPTEYENGKGFFY